MRYRDQGLEREQEGPQNDSGRLPGPVGAESRRQWSGGKSDERPFPGKFTTKSRDLFSFHWIYLGVEVRPEILWTSAQRWSLLSTGKRWRRGGRGPSGWSLSLVWGRQRNTGWDLSLLAGAHTYSLQDICGWGIGEDNSTRGFSHFHYDGSSFLPYDPKTHGWPVPWPSPQTLAKEITMQMAFKPGFLSLCPGRALWKPAEISGILDGLLGQNRFNPGAGPSLPPDPLTTPQKHCPRKPFLSYGMPVYSVGPWDCGPPVLL